MLGMKHTIFIMVVATMLLLVGCGQIDNTTALTNETLPVEEYQEPPLVEEQEPPAVTEETPPPTILPGQLDILLDDIEVLKNTYGMKEKHQLTMILSTTQYDKITAGTLSFKPLCSESARLFITLNTHILYQEKPVCDNVIQLPLTKATLQKGPNVIEFKNNIQAPYELVDIAVTFTYNDGTTELLPAESHVFEPENTAHAIVKDLGIVSMMNQVVRIFRITEEELLNDIYLNFDTVHREGKLIILLNAHVIYEGTVRMTGHELVLPPEHLKKGENVLTFIGVQA